jgi:hypothetical protein
MLDVVADLRFDLGVGNWSMPVGYPMDDDDVDDDDDVRLVRGPKQEKHFGLVFGNTDTTRWIVL